MMVEFDFDDVCRITSPFVAAGWCVRWSDSPMSGVCVSATHRESGDWSLITAPVGADARELLRKLARSIGLNP